MTLRHKAVKATLDKGYASEWNDDHHLDPTDELVHFDDFIGKLISTEWDFAQTTSGINPRGVISSNHAFCELLTSVIVGQRTSMRLKLDGAASNVTNILDLPVHTASVQLVSPAGAGLTHEWGLFANATIPFTANQHGAYFRVSANVLYAVSGVGLSETTTNLGVPNEFGVYRVEFLSDRIKFYVDDLVTPVATHTTDITNQDLTPKFSVIAVAAGAQRMRSDFLGLQRLRKK